MCIGTLNDLIIKSFIVYYLNFSLLEVCYTEKIEADGSVLKYKHL